MAGTGPLSGLWRSEDMSLVALSMHRDMLENAVRNFGDLGFVEFRGFAEDAASRRRGEYAGMVRACENIERRLRYFEELFPRFPGRPNPRAASPFGGHGDTLLGGPSIEQHIEGSSAPLGVPEFATSHGARHWSESPDALHALDQRMLAEEKELRGDGGVGLVPTLDQCLERYINDTEQLAALSALADPYSALNDANGRRDGGGHVQELQEMGGSSGSEAQRLQPRAQYRDTAHLSGDASAMFRGELVGVLALERIQVFLRLVNRVTKGNAFVVWQTLSLSRFRREGVQEILRNLVDPGRNLDEPRAVFRVMFTAESAQWRLHKLCTSLGVRLHFAMPVAGLSVTGDAQARARAEALQRLGAEPVPAGHDAQARIEELERKLLHDVDLMRRTDERIREALWALRVHHVARKQFSLREKSMYHVLNGMETRGDQAHTTCWVPTSRMGELRDVCERMSDSGGRRPILRDLALSEARNPITGDLEDPPTHFETNVITATFQGIVDSYGVPRYKETNPAVWTIITFPWLFGVMYGDVGHGLLITVAASLCVIFERDIQRMQLNEIADMIFGARYLLLMMGLFAVYLGLLYNDTFGLMLEYSPSRYHFPAGWESLKHEGSVTPACFDGIVPLACGACDVTKDFGLFNFTGGGRTTQICGCPLPPVGQDASYPCATPPGWTESRGGGLMSPADGPTPFGIDVAWADADNKIDFFNSFKMKNAVILGVVQMLGGLVLSLCNHLYHGDPKKKIPFGFVPEFVFLSCTFGYMCIMIIRKWITPWNNSNNAPNVLETMTNFFLSPGKYPLYDAKACADTGDCSGYELLFSGQTGLQTALLLIAFLTVPLLLFPTPILEWRRKKELEEQGRHEEADKMDMQEVVIKQVIHCIEYVLGCVSNTASYLRLWALSLAHAQLSDVFWKFAFMATLETAEGAGGGIAMYVTFAVWFTVTIGVLIVMEALSAFLHALRLHWVEFQNKFYAGDGRKFSPFSFEDVMKEAGIYEPWEGGGGDGAPGVEI
eukprot:Hpha_TRINITY_DN16277_c1_g1::TRINITY_DN16277_c1_g1_i1::g.12131::m.12131/K02154/ATPeV0A, ATP6N; V-type H+-transporting ATPase subunit a